MNVTAEIIFPVFPLAAMFLVLIAFVAAIVNELGKGARAILEDRTRQKRARDRYQQYQMQRSTPPPPTSDGGGQEPRQ